MIGRNREIELNGRLMKKVNKSKGSDFIQCSYRCMKERIERGSFIEKLIGRNLVSNERKVSFTGKQKLDKGFFEQWLLHLIRKGQGDQIEIRQMHFFGIIGFAFHCYDLHYIFFCFHHLTSLSHMILHLYINALLLHMLFSIL